MKAARFLAVAKKESRHILRDPRSLILALAMPLFLLWIFGWALNLDLDQVPLLILDQDHTPASRELIARMQASPFFNLRGMVDRRAEFDQELASGRIMIALTIPSGFQADLARGEPPSIQALLGGSDSATAQVGISYLEGLLQLHNQDLAQKSLDRLGLPRFQAPVEVRTRIWFNQETKSKNFIIPGLIVIIIMIIASQLTALTVTRERESGTLEWLIATPISPTELILGKLTPYLLIGLVDVSVCTAAGVFLFGVPFRGSLLVLALLTVIFLVGVLALGLLISVVSKNQLLASQLAILATFLPSFLLSGFIYPIYNMPKILQMITYLVPARYYLAIVNGVFLKGVGFRVLLTETLFLSGFTALVTWGAIKKFHKRLEG